MAFWIFKCSPEKYRLGDRLADPNPTITWTVSRFHDEIRSGDTAFLWETGEDRGIRAVLRVDEAPREIRELDSEQRYWVEPDRDTRYRVLASIINREVNLPGVQLRQVPGLGHLSVFHGFQQATNFPVTPEEGAILLRLAEQGFGPVHPSFEVGRIYNRRADIHGPFGGQWQGGISTSAQCPCIFLFSGPSGEQHGYRDGWNNDGVFLYTGEGQTGDMQFVRGNLAIRDHTANGRDLHLFESAGHGEGCRYLGQFNCVGWEHRRGPDTAGNDRQVVVFHLLPEAMEETEPTVPDTEPPVALAELRRRALDAVRPPGDRPSRETRRLYYERSAAVREYVLARANGVCEACRKPAPFRRVDGGPYLEPHHTRRIADGGPDHPCWVGGICPNCHKEIHHGEHGQEVNRRLEDYLKSIEEGR